MGFHSRLPPDTRPVLDLPTLKGWKLELLLFVVHSALYWAVRQEFGVEPSMGFRAGARVHCS